MPRERAATPDAPLRWHGAVLAGGESRRFGRDKVFATIGGRRLVDHALASLVGASSVSVVLGSFERRNAAITWLPRGVDALADDVPGLGPIGGLSTALARHADAWVAVLAADMPLVPESWWQLLAAQHRPGAAAVVPRTSEGRWEPLAALYHGSLRAGTLAEALEGAPWTDGDRSLRWWLAAIDHEGLVVAVPTSDLPSGALANVNRPSDAEAVARALAAAAR